MRVTAAEPGQVLRSNRSPAAACIEQREKASGNRGEITNAALGSLTIFPFTHTFCDRAEKPPIYDDWFRANHPFSSYVRLAQLAVGSMILHLIVRDFLWSKGAICDHA
jgi:hypothetical protein